MIIGVHGKKGSGKDKLFKIIRELDPSFVKTAFADPIKDEVFKIFSLNSEEEYDVFKRSELHYQDKVVSGREVVRGIGMLMRGYNDEQFNQHVAGFCYCNSNVVITDVRFENEINTLKDLGATLIKIKRDLPDDDHITEKVFDDELFDYVIDNNGTLEEYQNNIKEIYKENQ